MADDESDDEIMDVEEVEEDNVDDEAVPETDEKKVYLPGVPIADDEELVCDENAYVFHHQAQTGAPCLSFDILQDPLGDRREDFPLTCYTVAGTQAESRHENHVVVMKMSNIQKTKEESSEDSENDDSDAEDDEQPELETALINHNGCVNRIRATILGDRHIAATWSENGKVYIWDLTRPLNAVNDSGVMAAYTQSKESPAPIFHFSGHQEEGFAMDWSPLARGRLATGDCRKNIHLWTPRDDGTWHVDQRPYKAHTASVEDIQWSPSEDNVFVSCSVDRSMRVWDARAAPHKACMLTVPDAHTDDINVIHWNRHESQFIVSGGDDGVLKIWDLREIKNNKPAVTFKHHGGPITSVEWNPTDSEKSVFASAGADDQLTIWDLSAEHDSEAGKDSSEAEPDVPQQLLFIHQGQKDVKELHWHPQLPGVILSTALSGFDIFRTISL